ncbi:MAG: hypothetical protein H6721_06190 [Sandaracinus sp.]|nr:hypothetical protein [Sandaracinus sp.]MCB9631715.1 hypothetical protein [Sandaracinus sp.]
MERDAARAWARGLVLSSIRVRLDRVALYGWSEERHAPGGRLFEVVAERDL